MHLSELHKIVEQGEFSVAFVAADGRVVRIGRCVCTSFHSKGDTFNVRVQPSGEIRKIVRISVIELNGKEVIV